MHFSVAVSAQALTLGDLVQYSLLSARLVHIRDVVFFLGRIFVMPIKSDWIILTTVLTAPSAEQVKAPLAPRLACLFIRLFSSLGVHPTRE